MTEELQIINLDDYVLTGEGGNGQTYVQSIRSDILLKVNNAPNNNEATVRREMEMAKHVFGLGLPTPRIYEMVRVGDGYGLLFERIMGKRSLQRIMADFEAQVGRFMPLDVCIRSILMPTSEAHNTLFANVVSTMVEKYY